MERINLQEIDLSLRNCVSACEEAVRTSEYVATIACRATGAEQLLRSCRDCSDLCSLTARFIMRHAALTPELAEVCAKACDACATECARFEGDAFQVCADACRTCAEACSVVAI